MTDINVIDMETAKTSLFTIVKYLKYQTTYLRNMVKDNLIMSSKISTLNFLIKDETDIERIPHLCNIAGDLVYKCYKCGVIRDNELMKMEKRLKACRKFYINEIRLNGGVNL